MVQKIAAGCSGRSHMASRTCPTDSWRYAIKRELCPQLYDHKIIRKILVLRTGAGQSWDPFRPVQKIQPAEVSGSASAASGISKAYARERSNKLILQSRQSGAGPVEVPRASQAHDLQKEGQSAPAPRWLHPPLQHGQCSSSLQTSEQLCHWTSSDLGVHRPEWRRSTVRTEAADAGFARQTVSAAQTKPEWHSTTTCKATREDLDATAHPCYCVAPRDTSTSASSGPNTRAQICRQQGLAAARAVPKVCLEEGQSACQGVQPGQPEVCCTAIMAR